MHILVFNAGSSSLSYKVFCYRNAHKVDLVFQGKAHRVGVQGIQGSYIESVWDGRTAKRAVPIPDHRTAAGLAAEQIVKNRIPVDAVGHRFVHGGEYFKQSARLDPAGLRKIKKCLPLAPLHNPISYDVIKEAMKVFSKVPHYVVIDSAFHSKMPRTAYTYPLPKKVTDRYKFRRFGFHGISYSYICHRMPRLLGIPSRKLNMIVCHLGTGGASVMAVKNGISVDTSMGFSPNTGLIMSTRSGDIDPAVILHMVQQEGLAPAKVEAILNNASGLRGVSGFSSDITDIIARMHSGPSPQRAQLAFAMYIQRLKEYIGSYVMTLHGRIDALVFTDDIGVKEPLIREQACATLGWAGIRIDEKKNRAALTDRAAFVQSPNSAVKVVSLPTEEELMICLEGGRILGGRQ
jgi:acetate kinase